MVQGGSMTKENTRAKRLMRSKAARLRRKVRKTMIEERTLRLFARLRKKRKQAA